MTLWFRSLAVVGALVVIGGGYLLRERALRLQRRRLEELVGERTRALEQALTTRDVFLRMLAHDLKAPIVSLDWHAQALKRAVSARHAGQSVDGRDHRGIEAISAGAAEAASSIDELRDITRLATGEELPLHTEHVDVVELTRG